jgi:hypothetical protein
MARPPFGHRGEAQQRKLQAAGLDEGTPHVISEAHGIDLPAKEREHDFGLGDGAEPLHCCDRH